MRSDPTYSKRLRPLVPRPLTSNSAFSSTLSLHNRIIPSWNQPLCGVSGYGGSGRREMRVMSSRWNPTPEQLQALEEMYRRGTKTPTSDQIQHIAAKLRRFGRIEGKNVFYWFQNHKARDRQKKRRQSSLPPKYHHHAHLIPKPSSGLSCGCSEIEHPKKLPTKSNCTTASRNSGSMRGEVVHECTIHELQHHFTNEKATSQENAHSLVTLNLCKLLPPKNDHYFLSHEIEEDQTLELFPITGSNLSTVDVVKDKMSYDGSSLGTRLVPNQFFEFLPTKN